MTGNDARIATQLEDVITSTPEGLILRNWLDRHPILHILLAYAIMFSFGFIVGRLT